MTLLGVTWIFGVFAVGKARTAFQYAFCLCNSMQGFLIFVVRVLQYAEARAAWAQLVVTGTFKKHRGSGPATGSWCANTNPKQNSHSSMVRATSASSNSSSTVVFNSNIWSRGGDACTGDPAGVKDYPSRLYRFSGVDSLLKNCSQQKGHKKCNAAGESRKKTSSKEQEIVNSSSLNASDPLKYIDVVSPSSATLNFAGNQEAHMLFVYASGVTARIPINGVDHMPVSQPKVESFSTFRRPSPVPSAPKVPELPKSWNTSVATATEEHNAIVADHEPIWSSTVKTATGETSFLKANGDSKMAVS
ncbi:hypothetical protein V5799_007539 [Amblyomma americanum]|uniref:Uncharacterized protein n=1 Tax=Amblyomma americanum TaxID=6943 RepID=A0AAQ4FH33_AMBAM